MDMTKSGFDQRVTELRSQGMSLTMATRKAYREAAQAQLDVWRAQDSER